MKTISQKYRASLLRDLQKLREEIKELEENPPPRPDILDAYREAIRPPVEDKPSPI